MPIYLLWVVLHWTDDKRLNPLVIHVTGLACITQYFARNLLALHLGTYTSIAVGSLLYFMHVCVVVRTYAGEQAAALPAMLASLISAGDHARGKNCSLRMTADVVPTDPAEWSAAAETYNSIVGLSQQPHFAASNGFRIRAHRRANQSSLEEYWHARCGKRPVGTCGPAGDCGYIQTDLTLQHVLARSGANACDYVLVTNGDNLYSRSLFRHTCPHLHHGIGMVGFYFSSHYPYSHLYVHQGRVERSGPDVLFKTKLTKGWCDLGAVLMRADLMRTHPDQRAGYHFVDCGPWREADGRLIQRFSKRDDVKKVVLDRILYMHQ